MIALSRPQYMVRSDQQSQAIFEHKSVCSIIEAFKLKRFAPALYDACETSAGVRLLRFEEFNNLFPTFPVLLKAYYVRPYKHPDIFKCLVVSKIWAEYDELWQYSRPETDGRALALLIPFFGKRGGGVIHDLKYPVTETALCHRRSARPNQLFLEPTTAFIKQVANAGWKPEASSSDSPVLRPFESKDSEYPSIPKRLVEALGASPAMLVLHWIYGVLRSPLRRYRPLMVSDAQDENWIMANDVLLSDQVGVTERQARTAIDELVHKGYLLRRTGRPRTICLTERALRLFDSDE